MKALETGNEVLGIKEYNLDGCRFLYRPSNSKTTIVTFSAFPPKNVPQKYNYIKDFINQDCTFLAFLDTVLPAQDPRGTYYLSDNFGKEYLIKIHCIIQLLSKSNPQDIYLLGSSKGGVGALLLGLNFGYTNIMVNAPQAFIADYIKTRSLAILTYMLGSNNLLKEINYYQLNNILLDSIKSANRDLQWNIHITCGQEDNYHLKSLAVLKQAFESAKISIETRIVRGGHDNTSIDDYRAYFSTLIDYKT